MSINWLDNYYMCPCGQSESCLIDTRVYDEDDNRLCELCAEEELKDNNLNE